MSDKTFQEYLELLYRRDSLVSRAIDLAQRFPRLSHRLFVRPLDKPLANNDWFRFVNLNLGRASHAAEDWEEWYFFPDMTACSVYYGHGSPQGLREFWRVARQLSKLVAHYFLLYPWIPPRFQWGWLDESTLARRFRDQYIPDHYWWIEIMSHPALLALACQGGSCPTQLKSWTANGLHTYDLKEVFHRDLLVAQATCLSKIRDMPLPPPCDWKKGQVNEGYESVSYPLPATLAGFSDESRPDAGYPEPKSPLPPGSTECLGTCSPELPLAATPESNQLESNEQNGLTVTIK